MLEHNVQNQTSKHVTGAIAEASRSGRGFQQLSMFGGKWKCNWQVRDGWGMVDAR